MKSPKSFGIHGEFMPETAFNMGDFHCASLRAGRVAVDSTGGALAAERGQIPYQLEGGGSAW